MKGGVIRFDLEGPLSPQDNALELFSVIPAGKDLFSVINRYAYLLANEGRVGYEPGDTLVLIHPFLFHHGIEPSVIAEVSKKSTRWFHFWDTGRSNNSYMCTGGIYPRSIFNIKCRCLRWPSCARSVGAKT